MGTVAIGPAATRLYSIATGRERKAAVVVAAAVSVATGGTNGSAFLPVLPNLNRATPSPARLT
jgi:hypothetical protein